MLLRQLEQLPDLDHCKTAVLNSLGSPASRRAYEYAIDQFIAWYCSEPRPASWENCSSTASPNPLPSARTNRPCCPSCNRDRKSTRLNSSHLGISYAVFCL